MSNNSRKIMRCEVLFHLIKIRSFTRNHLIRIVYIDSTGVEICTNALNLKFSSIRSKEEGSQELVFMRYDFVEGKHILYRSRCFLEKHNRSDEWLIKSEIVLSWIEVNHLDELVNLYLSFTSGLEKFNLTTLRKIASKKSTEKLKDVILQNHTLELDNTASALNFTQHVLELQMHMKSVVFSHRQINTFVPESVDYLARNDILSYIDFLRMNQIILIHETNQQNCMDINSSSIQQSSLYKLDYICEQLTDDREKTKRMGRKRKFQEICDKAILGSDDCQNLITSF